LKASVAEIGARGIRLIDFRLTVQAHSLAGKTLLFAEKLPRGDKAPAKRSHFSHDFQP
jgi:hypothetical protein